MKVSASGGGGAYLPTTCRASTMSHTMSANSSFDCFYDLDAAKVSIISSTFFVNMINVLLLYGIIWFEHFGSDSKRMLRNRLVSANCWNAMIGVPFLHLLDTINYVSGPKPESFCFFVTFVRNAIKTNGLLIMNFIAISRYYFLFWMKNPAGVDDEFWSLAITIWSHTFSAGYNFIMVELPRQVCCSEW